MLIRASSAAHLLIAGVVVLGSAAVAAAAEPKSLDFLKSKSYDQLSPAEMTAAKNAARKRRFDQIVFCADPGNMPLSNDRREGFQNRIAEAVAAKLGARASFFWRPYLDRGLTRETFDNHECDVLLDMPVGTRSILLSAPIYRSTYVLAWRSDKALDIQSLDDPKLKQLKIGVFQHSAMRMALTRRGIPEADVHIITSDADLRPENQPWRQVQKVVDGTLDIAAVWGPFAGYVKTKFGAPLTIVPANLMEHETPLEFSLAFGIPKTDIVVKFALDMAMDEARHEIASILTEFGVPLVSCSDCVVQGTLAAHGSYDKAIEAAYQSRYLKTEVPAPLSDKASPDQVVDEKRLAAWIADGADLTVELGNAVIAGDAARITALLAKGAIVDGKSAQGDAPLMVAARSRRADLIDLLLRHKADPNIADNDGMTPLLYAVMRNHVPSIEALAAGGADLAKTGKDGYAPLVIAIGEGHHYAARTLIQLGVDVNARSGEQKLTPLMVLASQLATHTRELHSASGPSPLDLAQMLIEKGADVDAVSASGVSALMIAAGHNNPPFIGLMTKSKADFGKRNKDGHTALDIAQASGSEQAAKMLRLMAAGGAAQRSAKEEQ